MYQKKLWYNVLQVSTTRVRIISFGSSWSYVGFAKYHASCSISCVSWSKLDMLYNNARACAYGLTNHSGCGAQSGVIIYRRFTLICVRTRNKVGVHHRVVYRGRQV